MIECLVQKESRLNGADLQVGDVVSLEDGLAAEWQRSGRVRYASEVRQDTDQDTDQEQETDQDTDQDTEPEQDTDQDTEPEQETKRRRKGRR